MYRRGCSDCRSNNTTERSGKYRGVVIMLKRCVAVLLIMALVVVSAACGKSGNEAKPEKDNEQERRKAKRERKTGSVDIPM